uniref:Uncharacterized protein n=1 Tax=viral metagenome TaxID=1070528 RepID=A0A6H2A0U0_9ZZZZ
MAEAPFIVEFKVAENYSLGAKETYCLIIKEGKAQIWALGIGLDSGAIDTSNVSSVLTTTSADSINLDALTPELLAKIESAVKQSDGDSTVLSGLLDTVTGASPFKGIIISAVSAGLSGAKDKFGSALSFLTDLQSNNDVSKSKKNELDDLLKKLGA